MKQKLAYGLLGLVVVVAVGWSWHTLSGGGAGAAGFPVVCPHCNHFVMLNEDQLRTQPRSPEGEGFKCENCGKFGAGIGVRCERCGNWYLNQSARGSSVGCPHCAKKPANG